jgi:IS30 family transposase
MLWPPKVAGDSIRSIAMLLRCAPSTVCGEIDRNDGRGNYRASQADQAAWDRALRPKVCRLSKNRALGQLIAGKFQLQWPPEQIAEWLKRTPCLATICDSSWLW